MKVRILLLLILAGVSTLPAQDDPVAPIPPKRSRAAKVGAFGGFTPGYLFVDVAPINDFLVPAHGAALKNDGVFLFGGGGSAYIMFVPNLRVGGMGLGGQISSTSLDGAGIRRDAELGVAFAGVTIEYVLPVIDRLDVAVGGMLGGGGIDLTLRESAGGSLTWSGEWGNFGSGNYQNGGQVTNISRKLDGSFFVWVPSVSIEYAVLGWVGARLGASYVGMSAPSWTVDDKYDLLGVPGEVNGKGWMINAGLFVGTF